MEDGEQNGVETLDAAVCAAQDASLNTNHDSPLEVDLNNPNNVWETMCNKRRDAERKKETSKEAARLRLLECLLATNNEMLDLHALCSKYLIPIRAHDDNGEVYDRDEMELKKDVEAALEEEREKAWSAEHQAAKLVADPYVRTLSSAEGITQKTKFIAISNDDLVPLAIGWGPSLCGMFAGRFPGKSAVHGLTSRWRVPVKIAYHRKGWMVFSFRYAKDMDKVLSLGPQAIFGIPLILEPLTEDFDFNKKLKVNIPVWIKIPDLPLSLWSRSAIEKIASVAGTPVMVDEATILKHAIDGPRVQIIVNILDEIRKQVDIVMPDGREFVQPIVFENLPKYCRACSAFGHIGDGCPGPEEREKERLRRVRMQRPTSRAPSARAPSRGPDRGKSRGKSRGRSRDANGPRNNNANPNANMGKWMPVGKQRGWRSQQREGNVPEETDQIGTSNKFAGLETEERDEAEPITEAGQSGNNATPSDAQKFSYPVIIQGEAYRSAINAVSTREGEGQKRPKHTYISSPSAEHTEEVEEEEEEDVEVETPPFVGEKPGQELDPEEFPHLKEANSNRKGRKENSAKATDPSTNDQGRLQKDNRTNKPKGKEANHTLTRRGRSLGRDDLRSAGREPPMSDSLGPLRTETESSSSSADMMQPSLPRNGQAGGNRLNLSRTGRGPLK